MTPFSLALLVGLVALTFILLQIYLKHWSRSQPTAAVWSQPITAAAQARAEALLRASITVDEYASLLQRGYLEIPSRLYPNRIYQIPRKRRVRVCEVVHHGADEQRRRLGELCLNACEPVPEADLVLTHKWAIEADEATYLATANWISDNWGGRDVARSAT